jgi:hypothetical protein
MGSEVLLRTVRRLGDGAVNHELVSPARLDLGIERTVAGAVRWAHRRPASPSGPARALTEPRAPSPAAAVLVPAAVVAWVAVAEPPVPPTAPLRSARPAERADHHPPRASSARSPQVFQGTGRALGQVGRSSDAVVAWRARPSGEGTWQGCGTASQRLPNRTFGAA